MTTTGASRSRRNAKGRGRPAALAIRAAPALPVPSYAYRSRCREFIAELEACEGRNLESRQETVKRARAHADSVDNRNRRHRLAAGRLLVAILAEERRQAEFVMTLDQRERFLQQRDRHFDERLAQRDRHHAERMNRNALPPAGAAPTINNYGVIKIIKGVDAERI